MINVTRTYLPNINKYKKYVDKIFEAGWITNNGSYVNELKERLEKYLEVKNILLVTNATIGLQVAYRLLDLKNEVITTPFSFVATTSSLIWEGLKPIFVDIDEDTFCIDYNKIEQKLTPYTTGIVPVHVFGNGCEVEMIEEVALQHNLKVIYDAAHAFGIDYKGKSILSYGDISVVSFHATKIFHTIEGGALIINDDKLYEKAKNMINFGIIEQGRIEGLGINAKMNEFQAAMGLCILDDVDNIIRNRKSVYEYYLAHLPSKLKLQKYNKNVTMNYGYFPIVFNSETDLLRVKNKLRAEKIFPRRYFYPSLDTLNYIENKDYMEISNEISKRILCLPIYDSLTKTVQSKIIRIIEENLK